MAISALLFPQPLWYSVDAQLASDRSGGMSLSLAFADSSTGSSGSGGYLATPSPTPTPVPAPTATPMPTPGPAPTSTSHKSGVGRATFFALRFNAGVCSGRDNPRAGSATGWVALRQFWAPLLLGFTCCEVGMTNRSVPNAMPRISSSSSPHLRKSAVRFRVAEDARHHARRTHQILHTTTLLHCQQCLVQSPVHP